jgi:predicted HicB family RNase H-like nuclease
VAGNSGQAIQKRRCVIAVACTAGNLKLNTERTKMQKRKTAGKPVTLLIDPKVKDAAAEQAWKERKSLSLWAEEAFKRELERTAADGK